jgi:hypothetical protein
VSDVNEEEASGKVQNKDMVGVGMRLQQPCMDVCNPENHRAGVLANLQREDLVDVEQNAQTQNDQTQNDQNQNDPGGVLGRLHKRCMRAVGWHKHVDEGENHDQGTSEEMSPADDLCMRILHSKNMAGRAGLWMRLRGKESADGQDEGDARARARVLPSIKDHVCARSLDVEIPSDGAGLHKCVHQKRVENHYHGNLAKLQGRDQMCVHSLDSADDLLVSAGLHKRVRIWESLHDVRHGLNHVQKEDRDDEHVCMHTDHPESGAEICDYGTRIKCDVSEEQKGVRTEWESGTGIENSGIPADMNVMKTNTNCKS